MVSKRGSCGTEDLNIVGAVLLGRYCDHRFYSPDFASSDFYLFSYFKEHLEGQRFASNEKVKDFATT